MQDVSINYLGKRDRARSLTFTLDSFLLVGALEHAGTNTGLSEAEQRGGTAWQSYTRRQAPNGCGRGETSWSSSRRRARR
jgi:hypothetical protein